MFRAGLVVERSQASQQVGRRVQPSSIPRRIHRANARHRQPRPYPSSVGTSKAAVRLPSEPPPAQHSPSSTPISRSDRLGSRKKAALIFRSSGGRSNPPLISSLAPRLNGPQSAQTFLSFRISATLSARKSKTARALVRDHIRPRPALDDIRVHADPAFYIVPFLQRAKSATPVHGSRSRHPAALIPRAKRAHAQSIPLRRRPSAKSSAVPACQTPAPAQTPHRSCRASASSNFRDDPLPISSSEVHKNTTRFRSFSSEHLSSRLQFPQRPKRKQGLDNPGLHIKNARAISLPAAHAKWHTPQRPGRINGVVMPQYQQLPELRARNASRAVAKQCASDHRERAAAHALQPPPPPAIP